MRREEEGRKRKEIRSNGIDQKEVGTDKEGPRKDEYLCQRRF